MAEAHQVSDNEVYNTGKVIRISGEAEVEGGNRQYFDVIKAPIVDRHNKVVGLVGVARDVSDMRTVENKLKQHNEFLEAFSELVLSLPSEIDSAIRFDRVLRTVCDLLDADAGHLLELSAEQAAWQVLDTTDATLTPLNVVEPHHALSQDVFTIIRGDTSYIGVIPVSYTHLTLPTKRIV